MGLQSSTISSTYTASLSLDRLLAEIGGVHSHFAVQLRVVPCPTIRIFAPKNENLVRNIAHG